MARDGERRRFIERAAEETRLEKDLIKRDLGKLLLALEQEQTCRINAVTACHGDEQRSRELTDEEKAEALAFLKAPDLVEKIGAAFDACGLVGEGANRLAAYLACTSRKLDKPLAVIIQSTSAAGKSTLMEAVLSMFPEEERVKYSAMTGQSLYYLGETNLKTQDPRHRRGRGRREGFLCVEASAERRRTHHCQHRQRSDHGPHGNAGIPCRGAGDAVSHDHGRGDRRGTC